jgi:D-alanyl-D-alanine carboxypeptidase
VALRRDGESVIGVLLGSPSIWSDMNALMNAAFHRLG